MSSQEPTAAGEGPDQAAAGPDPTQAGGPDPTQAGAPDPSQAGAGAGAQPSEEELRTAYEAELERITTAEVIMQTAVSLLNLGARRLRPPESGAGEAGMPGAAAGRDLEQVRDAIDGVRALLGVLERRYPRELAPLRDALSQLQLAYAREAQSVAVQPQPGEGAAEQGAASSPEAAGAPPAGGAPSTGGAGAPGEGPSREQEERGRGPGPAESSGRLWVPGR